MKLKPWYPALVGTVCQVFGIGLIGVFSFFVAPLSREFGVGVATINVGAVFLLLAPAVVGPVVGRFVDSHSIRSIMLIGVMLATSSLYGLSMAASLGLAGAGFFAYAVGQTLYGPLVLNSLLIKTYQENVATALAVAAMGVSVGAVLLPFLIAWLMDQFSWRETLQVLAMGIALVLLLTVRLGLPRFPRAPENDDSLPPAAQLDKDFLRAPAFWIIGVAIAIIFNMALMVGVCYAPHFGQQGFANSTIATFMAAGGVAGFTAKLLVASFVDRWRNYLKSIAVGVVFIKILGMGALLWGDSFATNMLGVALIGGSGGAFLPLYPYLNSRYFDAASIGGVNGAQAPLLLPLGLVSAPLAGYAFDIRGSYDMAFMGAIALLLGAALLLAILPASGQRVPEN
ncbi:MAG: MFS transporter [Gammaproteobacteria bacterium]|nr:MFS transporter [Gammaproteobacteria bacterium]